MKKSLENLLEKQGIALLNTLSKEERRARTETIKARYREAGYDDLPHELVTFLTIFDGKEIKRNDGYMAFIYSQNLPTRQEMLYYESDAGVTELIPFGDVNADEVLCIDSVGSVWGVLDLSSWTPRKTYHYFYGGDLYTALENIIKGNVIAMNKLAVYDKLCCFIILSIEVALSSHFRHLFANLLGIINDASYLGNG